MSLAQVLTTYLTLNLLVAVAYLSLKLSIQVLNRAKNGVSGTATLRLNYLTLGAIFLIALAHPFIPKKQIFQPTAKVWSAQSLKSFSKDYTAAEQGGYLSIPTQSGMATFRADQVSLTLFALLLAVTGFGALRIGRDLFSLGRIRRKSYLIKRFRNVYLFANDQIKVPFSYWTPSRAVVVVPTTLMSKRHDYRIATAHEIQHHRQADTKWVYAMWALRVLCILNPFAHLWIRWLSELQEFACDETLVDRNKVDSRQYARCLIEVAENALHQEYVPACATGLVFLVERNLLKRRIEKMMNSSKTKGTQTMRSINGVVGGIVFALMTATAFASQSIVQDRRVSMTDAQQMAAHAQVGSSFPIIINDLVLSELNRYIGTSEGRDFMRKSLQRMESYRPLVESKLKEYQVPMELAAVPIIESGYQNLEQGQSSISAGVWQFIPSTARKYGLRVDQQVDERLNPELLTDVAMRYLKSNDLRFNDWALSVLAYNLGENKVQEAIDKTGSRDAWVLVRAGYENDKSYLARVMAAILIMKNPSSVAQ